MLIGIDDTDTLESPGTGRLCQVLLAELRAAGLGRGLGATRHQLLVDPRIPYTSHNSSACIAWNPADAGARSLIIEHCQAFLERESAPGSDPGLAVAPAGADAPAGDDASAAARAQLAAFGRRAKTEVLELADAIAVAAACGVHVSGHGGTGGGQIGALAAVGLHLGGDDGLYLWMDGLRQLRGSATYAQLRARIPIDAALAPDGGEPRAQETIDLGDWVRPVRREGRVILLLEAPVSRGEHRAWRVCPRDVVKRH